MSYIKTLTIKEHEEVLQLFGSEMENYYFLIDDIKRNNYHEENFRVIGEYENGTLKSILLNNKNNITYFSSEDRDVNIYKEIINDLSFEKMSGDKKFVEKFESIFQFKRRVDSYLGVMKKSVEENSEYKIGIIKTREEISKLYDLLVSTKEYQWLCERDKFIKDEYEKLQEGNARSSFLMIDEKMVSSCSTFNENENSAIIIGVVTHSDYRKKGYGSIVMSTLFNSLIEEKKLPYLFYNNPVAREVYRKLGVEEICEWVILHTK